MTAIMNTEDIIIITTGACHVWAIVNTTTGMVAEVYEGVHGHAMDVAAARSKNSIADPWQETTLYVCRPATEDEATMYMAS